jgi:nucleoid-associated protein YgaU
MGCVQQAVLDFDEEIQAPWRPRLVAVTGGGGGAGVRPSRSQSSGRSSSRVGVCRPPEPLAERAAPARSAARGTAARARPRPARPGSTRPGAVRVRLTRRARRLAVVLTLAAGVALGSWLGSLLAGGGDDLRLAGVQSVVVQPGDTLWSIATEVAGSGDVRDVVDRIQELNGIHSTVLVPGQVLELP